MCSAEKLSFRTMAQIGMINENPSQFLLQNEGVMAGTPKTTLDHEVTLSLLE